ncbi:hypothetical protein BKA56DRAFT_621265 [Ilyonectria sp. MPI-CAGE-AT-0026]|nr:hypothetical protein BKA56DRAFT_621265 [Ilyonectria sp. MPI-CAGE-AT-0026]
MGRNHPLRAHPLSQSDTELPCIVWTVPFPVACVTFLRIADGEARGRWNRTDILGHLSSVIAYGLFDMSYEGDYMVFPPNGQSLSEKEVAEMEHAVREIRSQVFRSDEEWMKEALVDVVTAQARYQNLPHTAGVQRF